MGFGEIMSDVSIIENPALASMLSDPIKIAILDLISKNEMTVSEISRKLKTNKAKISYHMKLLREARLVFVSREEQSKGMHFKYFQAAHKVLIPNARLEIKEEKRVALLLPIKTFIDGYLAGAGVYEDPKTREFFKTRMSRLLDLVFEEILVITSSFSSENGQNMDADDIRSMIYVEAVKNVLKNDEFASRFKKFPE